MKTVALLFLLLSCFLLASCGYRGIESLNEGDYKISHVVYYGLTRTYGRLIEGHAVNFLIYLPGKMGGRKVYHLIPWEVEIVPPEKEEHVSIFRGGDGRKHVNLFLCAGTFADIKNQMEERAYWRGNPLQTVLTEFPRGL